MIFRSFKCFNSLNLNKFPWHFADIHICTYVSACSIQEIILNYTNQPHVTSGWYVLYIRDMYFISYKNKKQNTWVGKPDQPVPLTIVRFIRLIIRCQKCSSSLFFAFWIGVPVCCGYPISQDIIQYKQFEVTFKLVDWKRMAK